MGRSGALFFDPTSALFEDADSDSAAKAFAWDSLSMSKKSWCHLESDVSSGWNAVARMFPCRTATITRSLEYTWSSTPSPDVIVMLGLPAGTGQSANTSTSWPTSRIAGARINTPRHVLLPPSFSASIGTESSVSKLWSWLPKKLRWTVQSSPPTSSWPPVFCPTALFARKMSPAQVPHTGFPVPTNSRSAGNCKERWGEMFEHFTV